MICTIWALVRFSVYLLVASDWLVGVILGVSNDFLLFSSCLLLALPFLAAAFSFFYLFLFFSFLCIFSINFISSDSFREKLEDDDEDPLSLSKGCFAFPLVY